MKLKEKQNKESKRTFFNSKKIIFKFEKFNIIVILVSNYSIYLFFFNKIS